MSPLSYAIPVQAGIDTYTEVDLVDIKFVQQLSLKPYQNTNLPILQAISRDHNHVIQFQNSQNTTAILYKQLNIAKQLPDKSPI